MDLMRNSLNGVITELEGAEFEDSQIRVAVHAFANDLDTVIAPTDDFDAVRTAVAGMSMGENTFFDDITPDFVDALPGQGAGQTADDPYVMVVLITDGARSDRYKPWHSHHFRPFDVSDCRRILNERYTMAVVNTRYVPMPTMAPYNGTVGRFHNQLEPNLRACASGAMYFEGTEAAEIEQAFHDLAYALRDSLRLMPDAP